MKRFLHILLAAALVAAALATTLTLPASAEWRSVTVRMTDGSLKAVVIDVPEGATLQDIRSLVPGEPVSWQPSQPPAPPAPPAPQPPTSQAEQPAPLAPAASAAPEAPAPPIAAPQAPEGAPVARPPLPGSRIVPKQGLKRRSTVKPKLRLKGEGKPKARRKVEVRSPRRSPAPRLRNSDGSPAPSNPGFVDALPGPSYATGVPNFVIRKFRVPVFLLPIYQAAGIQYGVRWEVLAAINEIETDYGRNLNVSSAGALGWMQFMPPTWKMYGVDANKDGKKDPFNPVDAIFAAARYLKAAGYEKDPRRAVFAYNHAGWYVDSVMLRAKLIAGVPADLVGSLTGLTEGRFPVAARARYADDLSEQKSKRVGIGRNAANVVESDENRRSIAIYAKTGAPVVATNDGQIKKIGQTEKLGRYVILQDVYGNRYMYSGLGSVARYYPVAKEDAASSSVTSTDVLKANRDPRPKAPASAGRQPVDKDLRALPTSTTEGRRPTTVKRRLFAHPDLPQSRDNGGYEQLLDIQSESGGLGTYEGYARPVRIDPKRFTLRALRPGARVIAGTPLGRVGSPDQGKAPHVNFGIRPAGKGAPRIDPKPILDGWKLLEATSIYRASGKNALRGGGGFSIGQILLMGKPQLEKRVLADSRIEIYDGGRSDIRSGQIDRRVLATLEYLAESGLRPTVTSLRSGHSLMTSSGNVSQHSSGNAVDIAAINGQPLTGRQQTPGGLADITVRRLMRLQGTMAPDQIISLLDLGANTLAMADHNDHVHTGFRPRFGANTKLSAQARAVLRPGQWPQLLKRLDEIENPVVPTKPSKYAIPVRRLRPVRRLGR